MVDADTKFNWAVAVDGSDYALAAFNQCFNEFYKKEDHIEVISVTDDAKGYLPLKLQPKAIYDQYHTILLASVTNSHYNIKMIKKEKNEETRELILSNVNNDNINLLFMGYRGRKGEKAEAYLMGTTVRNTLYEGHVPICVTKDYYPRSKVGNFNFCVFVDGSQKGFKCLNLIYKLGAAGDTVHAVVVLDLASKSRLGNIKDKIETFATNSKIKTELIELKSTTGGVSQQLIEYVNLNESIKYHFVLFGNNGLGYEGNQQNKIGSSCEKLYTGIHTNIILIP